MNTPATTMVAAWISAETGVGPAMASGNQVCRKNWPDFDMTAASRQNDATSSAVWLTVPEAAAVSISRMLKVSPRPAVKNRVIMPTSRPMSPTRFVMNALTAASEFFLSSHQWPISTKEQTPTSSQLVMNCTVVALMTSISIEAVNSERNAKKCV